MSYHFAKIDDVKQLDCWCRSVLLDVQSEVKEYFTFDFRLIGSGERRLVTQNSKEAFDLDYNVILQKDKKGLLDNPKKIKDIFVDGFNKILSGQVEGYSHVCDSTSVVTIKIIHNNTINFSFDVAIVIEADDGYFYKLIHDKNSDRYIWNRIQNSKNYLARFKEIKKQGHWLDFKNRYLELKNMHLNNGDKIKSFSVFLETLNEF